MLKRLLKNGEQGQALAVALVAAVAVSVYNRFTERVDLIRLLRASTLVSAALAVGLLLAREAGVGGAGFVLYVWKDVYIVVLLEIFWSFANVVFAIGSARWLYGVFCAMGSLGAMCGDVLVSALTEGLGSEGVVWLVMVGTWSVV